MRIRLVAAAIQVSIVHVSYVGSVPQGWSDAETKSNPAASAARAAATGSAAVDVDTFRPIDSSVTMLPR